MKRVAPHGRRADRRRLAELLELAAPARGRRARRLPGRRGSCCGPTTSTGRRSPASAGSASRPAPRRPRCWSRRSSTPSPSASTSSVETGLDRDRGHVLPAAAGAARRGGGVARGGLHRGLRRGAVGVPRRLRHRPGARPARASPRASRTRTISSTRRGGSFILTLYEKRVREADLPFFLGLMDHLAARGLTCPQPVHNRQRQRARPARRAAGGDRHLPRRRLGPAPDARHCRALGGALARLHEAGRDFADGAAERARRSRAGRRCSRRRPRRGRHGRGRARRAHPARAFDILRRPGRRACPSGVIHADLFTDNVFFIGDDGVGADRFLFRLHRRPRLRPRDLPQRLVLRARRRPSTVTKGQAMIAGYEKVRRLAPEEVEALADALPRRGAALHADAARRLAQRAAGRAGEARRTRSNTTASSPFTAVSRAPPNTGSCGERAGDDLHRRRLLGESGAGRLGGAAPVQGPREGAVRRRGAYHQQPHGAHRRDQGARGAVAALRGRPLHRLAIRPARRHRSGSRAGRRAAGRPPTGSRSRTRTSGAPSTRRATATR